MEGNRLAVSTIVGGPSPLSTNSETSSTDYSQEIDLSFLETDDSLQKPNEPDWNILENVRDSEIIHMEMKAAEFAQHVLVQQRGNADLYGDQGNKLSSDLHNAYGNQLFECVFCHQEFVTGKDLQNHIATLHDSNNTSVHCCEICQKSYATVDKLQIHLQKHTESTTYACVICQKTFKSKLKLKDHISVHKNTPQRFICAYETCEKSFTSRKVFENHNQKHKSDIHAFPCPLCDMMFKRRTHRNNHMRETHAGQKAFSCSICSRKFTTENARDGHLVKSHREVLQHKCSFCTFLCASLLELNGHMRNVHDCNVAEETAANASNDSNRIIDASSSPLSGEGLPNEFSTNCEMEDNIAHQQMRQTVNGILEKIDKDLGIVSDSSQRDFSVYDQWNQDALDDTIDYVISNPDVVEQYKPDVSYFCCEQLAILRQYDATLNCDTAPTMQDDVYVISKSIKKRGRPRKNSHMRTMSGNRVEQLYQQTLSGYRSAASMKKQTIFTGNMSSKFFCSTPHVLERQASNASSSTGLISGTPTDSVSQQGLPCSGNTNSPLLRPEECTTVCSGLRQYPQRKESLNSVSTAANIASTSSTETANAIDCNNDLRSPQPNDSSNCLSDVSFISQHSTVTNGSTTTSSTVNALSSSTSTITTSSSLLSSPPYSYDQLSRISQNALLSSPSNGLENQFLEGTLPPLLGQSFAGMPALTAATDLVSPLSKFRCPSYISSSAAATRFPYDYLTSVAANVNTIGESMFE